MASEASEVWSLVGYEQRLWKMTRRELKAECYRVVGVRPDATVPKSTVIDLILVARGIDDQTLINP